MKLKATCLTLLLSFSMASIAANQAAPSQPLTTPTKLKHITSPFDDDDFFGDQRDVFQQMEIMQHAMNQLMKNHFSTQKKALTPHLKPLTYASQNDVVITEKGDVITYKIKLPASSNNKVDVKAEKGNLNITVNVTQKITKENDNSKSVSYSHSSQTQAFKLPLHYKEKTMTSAVSGNELTVTFSKKPSKIS